MDASREKFTLRARSRLVGVSGNRWLAFEQSAKVARGAMVEAIFWGTSIVIWRSHSGELYAFRNIEIDGMHLLDGKVDGYQLVVGKHTFNSDGQLADAAVETAGFDQPSLYKNRVRVYPIRERYGLIFMFPGDPELSRIIAPPTIPWLDQKEALPYRLVDFTMKCHWSLIVENNCDFYHAYLHRKFSPFTWPQLQWVQRHDDAVQVHYQVDMGRGQLASNFTPGNDAMKTMMLWFDYPYQRSNLMRQYLHWCYVTPIDVETTRSFYIFLWGPIQIGKLSIPNWIRPSMMFFTHKYYLVPLLSQDKYALEEEQQRHDHSWDKHSIELNPLVSAFQKLGVEKWDEYLATEAERRKTMSAEEWEFRQGAGLELSYEL